MDFSAMNPAEQAHMSKIIEKKQVSLAGPNNHARAETQLGTDAGLHEDVLIPRRALLQLLL